MVHRRRTAMAKIHEIPWVVPTAVAVPFSSIGISSQVDNVAITPRDGNGVNESRFQPSCTSKAVRDRLERCTKNGRVNLLWSPAFVVSLLLH
jgi:hypothetical protein